MRPQEKPGGPGAGSAHGVTIAVLERLGSEAGIGFRRSRLVLHEVLRHFKTGKMSRHNS